MFHSSENDRGPQVVMLQALLRLHGYNLKISGYWQKQTDKAVSHFRESTGHVADGPVNGPIMAALLQGKRVKIVDAVDAEAGEALTYSVKEMRNAGIKPVINERRVGHGVEDAMSRLRKHAKDHMIGALRLTGHGNRGTWISVALGDPVHALEEGRQADYDAMAADWPSYIDYAHFEQMKPILKSLAPSFAPFGFVEAHSCKIGKQDRLLAALADTWGVPVSGGVENQYAAKPLKDRWGNPTVSTFMLTGKVVTAYPGDMSLSQWAERVDQVVPNLPGLIESGRRAVESRLSAR